jgi:putative FmdB family regulatory protein
MPTYEYVCQDCGERFERVLTLREHEKHEPKVVCPKCKSERVEQRPSVFQPVTARKD